jgi:hypothetical protein
MKKFYLLSALLISCISVFAQKQKSYAKEMNVEVIKTSSVKPLAQQKVIIWQNDFSTPSDWSFANSTQDDQNWVISSSTATTIGYNTGAWVDPTNTVTNENGYALFDSDAVGVDGGSQDATMMYTGTINCSSYPNVVIEFNQRIRMFTTTETILELSNNNGVTWVPFPVNLDKNVSTLYQEVSSINVSSVAGGQANVKFRLRYIGSWDYLWLVDDVKFIEQPANDLRSLSPYFAGTNNEGIEYGKTPLAHLDASYEIGGSVFNFGTAPNNSTGAIVNFGTGLSFPYNIGTITSDDTLSYGGTETPNLAVGTYSGIYTVSSIEEPVGSALFANNISKRNFAVTNNVYSIDGIGVNPTELQTTSTLGSNSFNTPTGTIFANMYHLRGGNTNNVVMSLEIGISNATTAGTQIQVAFIDTANFLADNLVPLVDANNNDALSEYYTITTADISAGKITVYFNQPVVLTDNAYFACVYTEVSAGNIIRILNDETVLQPWYASMIHLINDGGSYSNGNAFAIRMNMGVLGLDEEAKVEISVFPNPANEVINISLNKEVSATLTLLDVSGKVVRTQTLNGISTSINTASLNSGVYFVTINDGTSVSTQKVVIKK